MNQVPSGKGMFSNYYIIAIILLLIIASVIVQKMASVSKQESVGKINNTDQWQAPDINDLNQSETANLIRYGRALIANTAAYLGPRGSVAHVSNGMNCQNCHLDAGTRLYGSNFALVASIYPKYTERSGMITSIELRINECMERSLNGKRLDTLSREMKAMVNYIKWVGKDIKKGNRPKGTGLYDLPWLNTAANAEKGKFIYISKCRICHGANGEGLPAPDSIGYTYPPMWGVKSFNVSAGMYRITRVAPFVKHNMPFKPVASAPQLTDEESWDVAAFVTSMPRPEKFFRYDWPDIFKKPFDYPFGPYADSFTAIQHKYGPFSAIKKAKEQAQKKFAASVSDFK